MLLNELRELFGGGAAVLDALGIDAFDDEEGIARVIGEGGSHAVSPVPATAHGTRVIYIGELSGQRGVVLGTLAKRRECVAALGDAKAQVPLKGIEVLSAQRQGVFEGDRVVEVHRGRDAADGVALEDALEQVLDGATRAALGLELLIGLAPSANGRVLGEGGRFQVLLGECIGADEKLLDRLRVFG